MLIALRVEVNTIAACILIILLYNKRRTGKNMLDEHLYQILLYATLLYAIADTAAWLIDGVQSAPMRFSLYAINIVCYLFCVIVPYIWLLYAEFRLFGNEEQLRKRNRFFVIPVLVYSVLVILTPVTGWMFSFDENQMYQRGSLFLLQVVLSFLYVIYPTIRALLRLRTTEVTSERQECINIACFVISPIVGLVVQVLFYGMSAGIIATVIAELVVFINIQNKQISLDALTRLNNRGQLNRYLNIEVKKEVRQGKLYMLLLDIDRFKLINDTFGHKVGDEALIDMAKILQIVCGRHGGFLSRYGGDEFAIVIEKSSKEGIEQLMGDIQTQIAQFNEEGKKVYDLSTSIGYAEFGTNETQTMDSLIEAADEQMYQMKLKKHAQRIN